MANVPEAFKKDLMPPTGLPPEYYTGSERWSLPNQVYNLTGNAYLAYTQIPQWLQTMTPSQFQHSLYNILGTSAYASLSPEVYEGGGAINVAYLYQAKEARIKALEDLRNSFTGPESTFIKWLLNNMLKAAKIAPVGETFIKPKRTPAPIPDWMKAYVEPSIPYQREEIFTAPTTTVRRRGRQLAQSTGMPTGIPSLRPLSAQEELSPERLGYMAGYQAWGKMGGPAKLRESTMERTITGLADWERWWPQYIALSQNLFPTKAKLRPRWALASQ